MKSTQLSIELLVEDISKSLAFYRDILGFETEVLFPETNPVFAQVVMGDVHIKLFVRKEYEKEIPKLKTIPTGGSFQIYIDADGVEEYYKKIQNKVTVVRPLHTTDYGTIECSIEDGDGYFLCFSERT